MKKILKITILTLAITLGLFLVIIIRLVVVKPLDIHRQQEHMDTIIDRYQSNRYEILDESTFTNFDIDDPTIRLDDIQMLASHNSYKKVGPAIGRFFVGVGDSFDEAKALNYGYKNITDQLNLGIRSFEFDLRYRNHTFELTHVPLVDQSSQAVKFELLLEEIKLFSDHQTHLPIIILIEIKDDWMVLDPSLDPFDQSVLENLDSLIEQKLEDYLFEPSDIVDEDEVLKDIIVQDGWPLVKDIMNRTIFILHPGIYTDNYFNMNQTLKSQTMFLGSNYKEELPEYASLFVQNDVDMQKIQSLVNQHFMVRTRVDENLKFSESRYLDAISSGAQILTTDFSIGRSDLDIEDVIYLDNFKMVIKKEE